MWDLRVHADASPSRIAFTSDRKSVRYDELEASANRMAGAFRRLGLTRGDHVAALVGNRPEMLILAWAAWRSGVYLTPMSTALTPPELRYLVDNSDAKLVIADAGLSDLARGLIELSNQPMQWFSLRGSIAGYEALEPMLAQCSAAPHANEPPGALMMYTSGTTGAPKGVFRPLLPPDWHGTPPFAADLIDLFDLGGDNVRYLSTAPLYHSAPLRFALAVTAGGGTVVAMDHFDADEALRVLEQHAITHSQWVPAMFQRMPALPEQRRAAFAAQAHRMAIHGASPCPDAVKRAMIDWWGPILVEYYSASEGVGLTTIDSSEARLKPGSVGRARKGTLHIVDETGTEQPAGTTGTVYFSGIAPFAYYKEPGKTAARTLQQGWQTFGDVGHVDADGYLYLTDRLDDMIISGGVNLYPQEIESVLREVSGVFDCAVVGVPDERFGERPVAFIVADRAAGDDTQALMSRVRAHGATHLGRIKQPDRFYITEVLPRSTTGKLLRRKLLEILSTHQEKSS